MLPNTYLDMMIQNIEIIALNDYRVVSMTSSTGYHRSRAEPFALEIFRKKWS